MADSTTDGSDNDGADGSGIPTAIIIALVLSLVVIVAVGGRFIHQQRITAQSKNEQLRDFKRRMAAGPDPEPAVYDSVLPQGSRLHENQAYAPMTAAARGGGVHVNMTYGIGAALGGDATIYHVPLEDDTDYIDVSADPPATDDGSTALTSAPRRPGTHNPNSMYEPGTHNPNSMYEGGSAASTAAVPLKGNSMYVGGSTVARDVIDPTLVKATFVDGDAVYAIPMAPLDESSVQSTPRTVVVTPGVQNLALAPTSPPIEVTGEGIRDNTYMTLLVANTTC